MNCEWSVVWGDVSFFTTRELIFHHCIERFVFKICVTCDIVPPMEDISSWLTLELVRIVDFCCVGGWWCSLKLENVARGPVDTRSVRLVDPVCQLTPLSVGNLLANSFYQSDTFYLHFKKLNNAYLQKEARLKEHTPWLTAARCESCAEPWKVNRSSAKDVRVPVHILAIHCNRVRHADVKSNSPTLFIEHTVHSTNFNARSSHLNRWRKIIL